MALMHTIIPNAVNSHHNQVLSDPEAKSVECLTIKVHLAKERPNPARAPYLKIKDFFFSLGAFGTVALIIFGALGDGRDFMPDWEHNYLSWSFGLAFVGAVFDYVAGVLFIVEARIMRRKEIAREKQYPMEQRV